MFSPISRGAAALVICAFGAGAAQADVTAQDVWSDWKAYLEGTGYAVTGSEAMTGNTLTVSDIAMSVDIPEEDARFSVDIGDLSFVENGDGTVNVVVPGSIPITMAGVGEDGEAFEASIRYTQTGFSMVASGDPDNMTYNYSASSAAVRLEELTVAGAALGEDIARFSAQIGNIVGSTQMQGSDLRRYTQTATTGPVSYDMAFSDPETGGRFSWAGQTEGFDLSSVSTLPGAMSTTDMAAMVRAGFAADGTMDFGPGNSALNVQEDGEAFVYESNSQGGTIGVQFGPGGIGYDVQQRDVAVNLTGGEIPIPVSLNMREAVFKFLIPVMQGDDPQDFALSIGLNDFTMSDLIWGIFDPTGQLPRDAATIAVDLTGQAKLLADILDPAVSAQMENGPPPAELNALTIGNLEVTVAGASLTGMGDFTFDNSDLETFGGMPRPTGTLDLSLVGGNALLDKLVAMGLLPAEQAGGARMMMGLFAVPGDNPDTLNSKIEINEQGHILANGQRIQ